MGALASYVARVPLLYGDLLSLIAFNSCLGESLRDSSGLHVTYPEAAKSQGEDHAGEWVLAKMEEGGPSCFPLLMTLCPSQEARE